MTQVFGWWELDMVGGSALVCRASGQRFRYVGEEPSPESPTTEPWLRFDYEDDELHYPVIMQVKPGRYMPWPYGGSVEGPVLCVDHTRSAAVWRRETGSAETNPPFGAWRRVDDCLTDGLACIAALPGSDIAYRAVKVRGGWLNGAWSEELVRDFSQVSDDSLKRMRETPPTADRPFIMRLDTPPPSPWRFHGMPNEDSRYTAKVESNVKFPDRTPTHQFGLKDIFGKPINISVVPADRPLAGIEGRTAYMRSEDGARILFPCSGTDKDDDRGPDRFSFVYADEDFFAYPNGKSESQAAKANWEFWLGALTGGRRDPNVENDLWVRRHERFGNVPSYALWRRLSWAIMDAWLLWEGSSARCDRWSERLALVGASSVTVAPLYLGGMLITGERCVARLAVQRSNQARITTPTSST